MKFWLFFASRSENILCSLISSDCDENGVKFSSRLYRHRYILSSRLRKTSRGDPMKSALRTGDPAANSTTQSAKYAKTDGSVAQYLTPLERFEARLDDRRAGCGIYRTASVMVDATSNAGFRIQRKWHVSFMQRGDGRDDPAKFSVPTLTHQPNQQRELA